jgi:hypothetical protein
MRATKEKQAVEAARRRVDAAKEKIQRLAGSSRATRVFSSAKFPAREGRGIHPSVFGDMKYSRCKGSAHQIPTSPVDAGSGKTQPCVISIPDLEKRVYVGILYFEIP